MSEDEGFVILIQLVGQFGPFLATIAVAFFVGRHLEKKHLASLRERELATSPTRAVTIRHPLEDKPVLRAEMVSGSVVISLDYFKRIAAALRSLVGGNVRAFEPLLVRARREALLRMKEDAIARGYRGVINVRLETSRLASGRSDGKGTAGVEVLAFGTGILYAD